MKTLVIDIETVPCQKAGCMEEIRKTITPPGNISKQETIDKWMAENADKTAEEQYLKTSFDGSRGEIVCIGWAVDDGEVQSVCRGIDESETTLLARFYEALKPDNDRTATTFDALGIQNEYQIVGHNVIAFDIRFIYQRSVINRVYPSFNLRQDERYNGGKVFDTMTAWAGWNNRISLANLCAALDIPVKSGGMDGSQVWQYIKDGRKEEVAAYCREDVSATREVYRRMKFCQQEAPIF